MASSAPWSATGARAFRSPAGAACTSARTPTKRLRPSWLPDRRNKRTNIHTTAAKPRSIGMRATATALGNLSGIPSDAVERALLNHRADVVLVIAKAVGLSSITTEALVRLRAADRSMSAEDVAQVLAKFNRLPRDSARRVLNFFRIRLEKGSAPTMPPELRIGS